MIRNKGITIPRCKGYSEGGTDSKVAKCFYKMDESGDAVSAVTCDM